ncbi:MAG TPA: DEAD/DEAH box helicase [Stellaceae bacterium]|nr:DEAD/DEAH box helicase [Stellaceae bacterium]
MSSFSDFGLLPSILDALAIEGYATPTPIQSQALPFVLAGRDLCGIAQTGTGKTAAFALPILHRLSGRTGAPPRGACRVLVLSPTRELASQIADSFRRYGGRLPLSTAVVFGGVPLGAQQRRLASGVDILVATPGRLLDLIDRRALVLSSVEILVLDEADRMLDLGFIHALRRIVKLLPRRRQTLLFSATMPSAIAALAEDYLDDPVKVSVTPAATTVERVEQRVIFVASERKHDLLAVLLRDPNFERVLVFTRTKHGADRVVRHLVGAGIEAAAIHGNKSQPQRERALAGFRSGGDRVLVATDIAARGIDVDGVSHVINFDLPNVPEDYVHRIGRTARAGAGGTAIAFCSDEERPFLRGIEKLTRVAVPAIPMPAGVPPGMSQGVAQARDGASDRRSATRPQRSAPRNPHRNAGANPPAGHGGGPARHPTQHPKPPSGNPDRHTATTEPSSLPAFLRRAPSPSPSGKSAPPETRQARRAFATR